MGQAVPAGEAQHDGTAQPHAIVFDGNQVWARRGTVEVTAYGDTEQRYVAGVDSDGVYNYWRATFDLLTDAIAYRDQLNREAARD